MTTATTTTSGRCLIDETGTLVDRFPARRDLTRDSWTSPFPRFHDFLTLVFSIRTQSITVSIGISILGPENNRANCDGFRFWGILRCMCGWLHSRLVLLGLALVSWMEVTSTNTSALACWQTGSTGTGTGTGTRLTGFTLDVLFPSWGAGS